MNNKIKEIAKILTTELSRLIPDFSGIYLYGSQVNGDYKNDSDIDVVGLFENVTEETENKLYKIISLINYTKDVFIDIHPMTMKELNNNYIFHNQVVNKGIFYGRTA